MDIKIFEYLIAIAEEKSISRAAERFYLSQPSLSRHLCKMEMQIGAKLFHRHHNEMLLTNEGKIFINNAQAILHVNSQTEQKLESMRNERKNKLRLIIGWRERISFLRNVLPCFNEKHPDFSIEIIEGGAGIVKEYLINDMADMGVFVTNDKEKESFECVTLRKDELILAISPQNPALSWINNNGFSFEPLKNDCFILKNEKDDFRQMEQGIFDINGFVPQKLCEVDKLRTALHMVGNGQGNAFLPRSLLEASESSIPVFSMIPSCDIFLVAAYSRQKVIDRQVNDLLELMIDMFKQQ